MSAPVPSPDADEPHPLLRSPSPATISSYLLEPERERFVAEYGSALDDARRTVELAPVLELVEHWRGIALLHTEPRSFWDGLRRWAEKIGDEPSPDDEPVDVTRRKTGI